MNDRDNLSICLLAEDNLLRSQIMMQGLTVWFDPQGGKKKTLGIKYPLGRPAGGRPGPRMGEHPEGPELDNPPGQPPAELEVIRSGNENPQKMNIAEAKGIELKAVPSTGLLVYELKIPLAQTAEHPLAVGAEPGKTVGIGFETGKLDSGELPGRGPRGMPGGRGGLPPMGGGPGGRGRGGFGLGHDRTVGLKLWIIVKLAPWPGQQLPGTRGDIEDPGSMN